MEQYRKILIPTDSSEEAKLAVQKGLSLAKLIDAEVVALYVIDHTVFAGLPPEAIITDVFSLLRNEGENAVNEVKSEGDRLGVKVDTKVSEGSPAAEIVETAEKEGCDMIVMGTVGRSGLAKLLLGSVAEQVVRHAPCPVMVVRLSPSEKKKM